MNNFFVEGNFCLYMWKYSFSLIVQLCRPVASGIYWAVLRTEHGVTTRKLVVVR